MIGGVARLGRRVDKDGLEQERRDVDDLDQGAHDDQSLRVALLQVPR